MIKIILSYENPSINNPVKTETNNATAKKAMYFLDTCDILIGMFCLIIITKTKNIINIKKASPNETCEDIPAY